MRACVCALWALIIAPSVVEMDASMMAGTQMPDDLYADHGYKLIVTTVVSFILATAGIVGRFAARLICQKRLEANDYLITAGYVRTGLYFCTARFAREANFEQ